MKIEYEEDLIVIVPVLDRPKNVPKLVASHAASSTPGPLMFIVTDGDTNELRAVEESGANYRVTKRISWPHKINETYRLIHDHHLAEWVLFGADDINFHSGWWEATAPFRAQPEINVIGTNDLGNPRVIAGDHTTHALVRSSYMGTVDDPDSIVHTGYRHWCVDDEFLWTAKLRGCWVFAPTAIVEHLHPYWVDSFTGRKKGKWDATYAQGELAGKNDMKLWRKRSALLGLQWADSSHTTGYKF